VRQANPAVRLYERLGFIRTAEDAVYIQMERRPE
jgi:ribosomal protein S18 acetylase RimI-like enzyme